MLKSKSSAKAGLKPRSRPPRPSATRQRLSAGQREEQILAEAVRFFAEVGFTGQTRELAQRLGITQPLLYRYFPSKRKLIERVFEEIYLKPIDANWRKRITDRSRPLHDRLCDFYMRYAEVTYRYEWIRIYMFSGLMGEEFNRRYIQVVEEKILRPICMELRHFCGLPDRSVSDLDLEQVWVMHGGLFYYAVRKHIYHSRVAADFGAVVARAIDGALEGWKAMSDRGVIT